MSRATYTKAYFKSNQLHAVSRIDRVGRGNLVLRHFVPHFPSNFSRHCVLCGGSQRPAFRHILFSINSKNYSL